MKILNLAKKILIFKLLIFTACSARINIKKSTSKIKVRNGAGFVVEGQISGCAGTIEAEEGATVSGSSIIFDDGIYDDAGNKVKISGTLDLSDDAEITLEDGKTFKGKRGSFFGRLKLKGAANRLEGFLMSTQEVELQDSQSTVTCALQGRVPCNMVLNGGELLLEEDLHFVDDMFFTGSGIIKLNRRKLRLGGKDITCNSALYFDEACDIELNSNLHLSETWTFSGESVLGGNGNFLYLDDGGEIVVEQGSSLLLHNVTIRNISGNNIRCLDNNATLSFHNVTWIQDGNYSFTTGSLDVIERFVLRGDSVFAYQSTQTSNISSYGKVVFDRGMTFSFDPICSGMTVEQSEQTRNLLSFEDSTSILELKGATLHVTSTSMKLTKGTFRIKDRSYIVSELADGFHKEEGLILGDNNSSYDVKFEVGAGSILEVVSGALSYKNMLSSSCEMLNDRSIICVDSGAKLKLHQTLDVGEGLTILKAGSRLARVDGKSLLGPLNIEGAIWYEKCYN